MVYKLKQAKTAQSMHFCFAWCWSGRGIWSVIMVRINRCGCLLVAHRKLPNNGFTGCYAQLLCLIWHRKRIGNDSTNQMEWYRYWFGSKCGSPALMEFRKGKTRWKLNATVVRSRCGRRRVTSLENQTIKVSQ